MMEVDTLKYEKVKVSNELLECYEEAGYTYLHCTHTAKGSGGAWINIHKTSYLIKGDKKLKLIDAINIPYAPERYILKKFGDTHHFTLVFPAVPKDWNKFDFIEICNNSIGFSNRNILRNDIGAYRVRITF